MEKEQSRDLADKRSKVQTALEGKTLEEQVKYLTDEVASGRAEKAARDKKIAELQEQIAQGAAPTPSLGTGKIAEALADLKARDAIVGLKEMAIERAERENIPYSLALALTAKDEETTNRNLDTLVNLMDATYDKGEAAALEDTGRTLGDNPVMLRSQVSKDLAGKKGRGLKVHELSQAELSRIPRSLRSKLIDKGLQDAMDE